MRCCRVRYSDIVQLQKASITVNYESTYITERLKCLRSGKKYKIGVVDDSKSTAQLANWCLFQIAKL